MMTAATNMQQATEQLGTRTRSSALDRPLPHRRSLRRAAYDLWFAPDSPTNLGFSRALLFALILWFYFSYNYVTWARLPAAFANTPIFLFRLLHLPIASPAVVGAIQLAWKVCLFLSCIGLFTRFATKVAFLAGIYLMAIPNNFGKTGHGNGILVLTMFILALSRCGDGWSVDSLIRASRERDPARSPTARSGEYRW